MRRQIVFVILAVLACLAALTGCSRAKANEKDIQVVLEVNGKVQDTVTVNIFNNAVVSEPAAPENKVFKGWTTAATWTDDEVDSLPVTPNTCLIRYNDIKDAVAGASRSVVLKAVFAPVPRRDLVIAWYAKEGTSGLNQSHMGSFESELKAYLKSIGKDPEKMDILIRGYDGGVADTCAAIKKDADVDIMVGWSSTGNLTGTGGWTEGSDFLENVGGITIGSKARYTARITDSDFIRQVYAWIQSRYGAAPAEATASTQNAPAPASPTPVATEQAPAVQGQASDGKLVVGWYAKTDTSGMDQKTADSLEAALRHFLDANGYRTAELVFRPYDGKVAEVQDAVIAAGDVDLMVAMKAFALDGVEMEVQENITVGPKTDRRLHRISSDELSVKAFEWLKSDEALSVLATGEWAAPATTGSADALVIGWYAKSETSGLNQGIIDRFIGGLKDYLKSIGAGDVELVIRPYDGKVAEVQDAVIAAGDVDLMVGMKAFALEGVEMEVQQDIVMGEKTDRRFHRISSDELAAKVFEWLRTEEARDLFRTAQ